MEHPIYWLKPDEFPRNFKEIPQPPKQLNARGNLPPSGLKLISIVGSRRYTSYGKQVVEELVAGLKDYPVGIVSGLAIGMDSLAHQAALDNDLYTLAIPGGGISDQAIYPSNHKNLARKILDSGGGLLSEFDPDFRATVWSFPQRNRLVAGISQATLMVEAAEKSGTLITGRLATDYNKELLVVPGNIFSKNSYGVHQFLKLGAIPVTTSKDILEVLDIEEQTGKTESLNFNLSPAEQLVVEALREPAHKDEIIRQLNLNTNEASQLLMMMELEGKIKSEQNIYRLNL